MSDTSRIPRWVEVVSAIGVIAGLGLVSWELRQNTIQATANARAVEVAAYQDLISQITDLNAAVVSDPEFAELQERFFSGDTVLAGGERNRMNGFLWMLFRHGDMAFYQYERGVLGRERFESAVKPITDRVGVPGMHSAWVARRDVFTSGYRAYLDSVFGLSR